MISEKLMELINRDLDGALSSKEKMQLEKHLESSQETNEMLTKLRAVHKKLHEMSESEPPDDLRESIMKSLPQVCFAGKKQSSPVASKITELFGVPKFQMAGMFSLGAAAALLFLVISNNLSDSSPSTAEKAIGTILAPEKIGKVEQVDSRHITIDDYKVDINTSHSGNSVFINVNLFSESNQPVQLTVSSGESSNFRFQALDYSAPNLIYANFGNDFFSAAIAGSGKWVLTYDDATEATETVKIELKTGSNWATECVAVRKNSSGKD